MDSWFEYLKHGLSRKLPEDQLKEQSRQRSQRASLNNLRPYLKRHWRKGVFGAVLVLISSLLTLPQPLITRYLVDEVILGHQQSYSLGSALLRVNQVLAMGSGHFSSFFTINRKSS
jgi:ABC-type multidrug transport system fused ATPase/permease subunit